LRRDRLGDDLAAVVSGKPKAPASGKTAEPMPPDFLPPEREEAAALGVLILVAEDNPTNQMVMDRLMGKLGYAIDLAGNGGEALEKLKASRYGLLLTDCHMPGMDGFSLAARIRETEAGGGRHLPIIALTGDALEGTAQKCLDAGMDDYLSKPIAIDKLDLAIRRWLPEAAAARRLVQPAALPLFRDA